MIKPFILKNSIQKYEWGSYSAIQKLINESPSEEPWAELWMGAHIKASSKIFIHGKWFSLSEYIRSYPEKILGKKTAVKFNNALPYLFKVLAAQKPLSIQAHPNVRQAKNGYERENKKILALNDRTRNYKDNNHKPECICALTRFTGLKGFRKTASAVELIESFCPHSLSNEIKILKNKNLKLFFQSLMELSGSRKNDVISEATQNAEKMRPADIISQWLLRLFRQYPADIGVISPLFLNLFSLEPGQALFLPAGELHAYLDGMGIELMANSDNVLRGGLTSKHVDIPELLNVLNFVESDINVLTPEPISDREKQYPSFAEEFQLSTISIDDSNNYTSNNQRSVEILLCIDGNASVSYKTEESQSITSEMIELHKGDSVLIPAALTWYQLSGNAHFYKAGVPL